MSEIQIITFYEFKRLDEVGDVTEMREGLRQAMQETGVRGTIILANEGFNSSLCGTREQIAAFIPMIERELGTRLKFKSSFTEKAPFRKIDVKVKPEIVTLRRDVDISLGAGTHVSPENWNELISDPNVFVLDARNDYEFQTGTFARSTNPSTEKFSDLPEFVEKNLSPETHPKVAMFCTGGIRCEKFAPYLRSLGFDEVFQLDGGILKYLEDVPADESLWQGECYVFDERITVDHSLKKGNSIDRSGRHDT